MRLTHHSAISLVLSGIFYVYARSTFGAAVFFASGVLVDVDHFLEYFLRRPFWKFRVADFLDFWHNKRFLKSQRIFIVLHSYEVVAALLIAGIVMGQSGPYFAALLGWLQHILVDQLANTINFPLTYSLVYRFHKRFRPKELFCLKREALDAE